MANPDEYNRIEVTRNGTTSVGGSIGVRSPYHPEFPKRARAIGGEWDKAQGVWRFPHGGAVAVRESQVRDLCVLCFGAYSGTPTKAIPKRERKARRAKGAKGLSAYSSDDLLAELRRRGLAVLHQTKRAPEPAPSPAASDTAFTL
jgi:hypothetical protein